MTKLRHIAGSLSGKQKLSVDQASKLLGGDDKRPRHGGTSPIGDVDLPGGKVVRQVVNATLIP